MSLNWRPVEGFGFNLAREADTPFGLAIVKPVRPRARTFMVRVGHEIVSRFESSLGEGMDCAENYVNHRQDADYYSKARL